LGVDLLVMLPASSYLKVVASSCGLATAADSVALVNAARLGVPVPVSCAWLGLAPSVNCSASPNGVYAVLST